jgi:hypothetical protein
MRPWLYVALAGAFLGTASAQGVAEKPAPSRYYGTARPQAPGPGPGAAPQAVPGRPAGPGAPVGPPVHGGRSGGYSGGQSGVYSGGHRGPVYVAPPPPRVGVIIGTPYPRPYYAPRPYGYPGWGYGAGYGYGYGYGYPAYPRVIVPPVIMSPAPPTVYIERPAEAEPPSAGYWYWCADPEGWYPEVPACVAGWQPVPPRAAQ